MYTMRKSITGLALLVGAMTCIGTVAQPTDGEVSLPGPQARNVPAEAVAGVEKECVDANGAAVCWLNFSDGTRCVVANNAGGNNGSTAINCHFSTPMERLRRMPKD